MSKWKPLLTPMGVCHKLELFGDVEYQKMKPLKQSNSVLGLIVGVNLRIVATANWLLTKVGCIFSMVISSEFRIGQYREDTPHINLFKC